MASLSNKMDSAAFAESYKHTQKHTNTEAVSIQLQSVKRWQINKDLFLEENSLISLVCLNLL